jgi:hypothetical protein
VRRRRAPGHPARGLGPARAGRAWRSRAGSTAPGATRCA